jgi:demethylmenaquinone methyltransferase/2-methoxy-6-polyprenyl-1,4-benzoquinol methylase
VGGEARFRQLALQGLTINPETKVLDLCCGSGQATQVLVQYSQDVTGLDASPLSLKRAQQNVSQLIMWKPLLKTCRFQTSV